jgi:thymidylate synthase
LTSAEFYDLHERIYEKGKKIRPKNRSRWGNYFLRFTRFGVNRRNQIDNIIASINRSSKNQVASYFMHASSIDCDSNTTLRGNPCLQYVQCSQYDSSLHLTAIYRNHDFLQKSLGNYIALSKLLGFVCEKTNSAAGTVTCHSIHYYLEQKLKVKNCLDNLTW